MKPIDLETFIGVWSMLIIIVLLVVATILTNGFLLIIMVVGALVTFGIPYVLYVLYNMFVANPEEDETNE